MKNIRALALDLDGVVYEGKKALPGAVEALAKLRAHGYILRYLTNNSASSRLSIQLKLIHLGIEVALSDIYTSGTAAVQYVSEEKKDAKVLIIGEEGLQSEALEVGLQLVTQAPCDYLIVGMHREFTYQLISLGLDALLGGAIFIACNRDGFYPAGEGRLLPGCGAMVGAIEGAIEKLVPPMVIGKPNTWMLERMMKDVGVSVEETLVVGDMLLTDIEMARRMGTKAVLITPYEYTESGLMCAKSLCDLVGILQP